jgi:hypothetical protein
MSRTPQVTILELNAFSLDTIHSTHRQFSFIEQLELTEGEFCVSYFFVLFFLNDSRQGVCVVTHFKRWREAKLRAALSRTMELSSRRVRSHGMSFCNFLPFPTILLCILSYLCTIPAGRSPPHSYFLISRSSRIVRE